MTGVVHVIDDDEALCGALVRLARARGFRAFGYASAVEFLQEVSDAAPGCVVTDVQMPEMTGIELLKHMQARLAEFPIIVLTGQAKVSMAVEALRAGASDFVEKPFESDALISAIARALEGVNIQVERANRSAEILARIKALSPRERDVLSHVVRGASNKEVARGLGISHRTVEVYRAALMMKMHATSLSELIRMTLLVGEPVHG